MAKSNHESPTFTRKTSISTKGQVNMARKHKQTTPTKQEQHQPSTLSSHNITLQTRKRRLKFEGQTDFINEEARGANGTIAFRRQEAPMGMAFPCT